MPCIICGANHFEPVPFDRSPAVEVVLRRRGLVESYGWRLCMACGNAQPAEPPNLQALEEIWQSSRAEPDASEAIWAERARMAKVGAERSWEIFSPLHRGPGRGRFLDIACGQGVTVKRFQDGGWDAEGNDIDATMKPMHNLLGIRTMIGPVERQEWTEPFDLIQIAYAIYFVTDPRGFLERLRPLLKPGGHLAVVLADHLAYTQSAGPSYAHTFIPTAESMRALLAHAGYRAVLAKRLRDTDFIAARVEDCAPPAVDTRRILRAHRTRALRWSLLGANRARARRLLQVLRR
jgi:SAM-dependent methyltransferase